MKVFNPAFGGKVDEENGEHCCHSNGIRKRWVIYYEEIRKAWSSKVGMRRRKNLYEFHVNQIPQNHGWSLEPEDKLTWIKAVPMIIPVPKCLVAHKAQWKVFEAIWVIFSFVPVIIELPSSAWS